MATKSKSMPKTKADMKGHPQASMVTAKRSGKHAKLNTTSKKVK